MSLIKLAEAQLTGFGHRSQGYSIIDLAESMGLKKHEWLKLRDDVPLKELDKKDLDQHFKL